MFLFPNTLVCPYYPMWGFKLIATSAQVLVESWVPWAILNVSFEKPEWF